MQEDQIKQVLEKVAAGGMSAEEGVRLITGAAGYENLGHTRLDTDRRRRRGVSEAIFCQGKTAEQVLAIVDTLDRCGQSILCTRVSAEMAQFIFSQRSDLEYSAAARLLYKRNEPGEPGLGPVAVVTAGTSDIPVAEEAALCAEIWGNEVFRIFDVGVAGIHRLMSVENELHKASVVIVAAGMEGALPSVVAGLVKAPVIAVPTSIGYGASFGGLAAVLGMLNSCSGGLATVNIDNGFGAALLAHMIVHPHIQKKH